jgi:hypothetical protein
MPRIRRPGEDDPVTRSASDPKRNRRDHNPGSRKGGGGGGGGKGGGGKRRKVPDQSGPITDLDIPALYSSTSGYGRKKEQPFLDTAAGVHHANANPEDYINYTVRQGGLGGGTQPAPWRDYLANEAPSLIMDAYGAALNRNNELGFMQYMQTLGVPQSAQNHVAGPVTPIGTGQPIDTGNPFTSSSGTGVPRAPGGLMQAGGLMQTGGLGGQPTAPAAASVSIEKAKRGKGKGKGPAGLDKINPPSGAGATAKDMSGFTEMLRRQFLSRDPVTRGVGGTAGQAPGRWSPWG